MSIADLPEVTTHHAAPAVSAPVRRFSLTLEHVLYLAIFALALLTRLWGLDNRALHHDETLHAVYSYYVFAGRGFVHDPLLHGPFLYFWGALIYLLFGDNNYTARLPAALFGSILPLLPFLIRRELGRGTALLASCAMLISPVFLYVGRFIRHDIYAVTFEMLAFVAAVRYLSTRRARWLYLVAASLALMQTTMETFYLYLAIFAPLVLGAFFWRVWRPGVAVIAGLGVIVATLLFVLPGHPQAATSGSGVARQNGPYVCPSAGNVPPDNPILVDRPGFLFGLPPLPTADNEYALCVRHQPDNDLGSYLVKLGQFFWHPAVLSSLVLGLAVLALLYVQIWRRRGPDGQSHWARARGDALVKTFASLGWNRRWLVALAIAATIYALLFSAFLTNPVGIMSGTSGSLLYWLAQHEVQRGEQPRHYYLVLLWIYEPLMLLWATLGLGMVARLLLRRARHWLAARRDPDSRSSNGALPGAPIALPIVLAWWLVATLFLYSWAGEKMPWLTLHLALPLTLLGSWALARTVAWWRGSFAMASSTPLRAIAVYGALFGGLMSLCFLLITIFIRSAPEQQAYIPYVAPVAIVLVGLLTFGAALMLGRRWAVGALAVSLSVLLALYGIRSAFQLSFRWGDVPREMLIYTQTSPDVMRVLDRLEKASIRRGGMLDMPIWYDNETVWDWYMRRFTAAVEQPAGTIPPLPDNLQALLLLRENVNDTNRQNLTGMRIQRYPLRWWFPEDATYRLPADWMTRPVSEQSPLLMRVLRTPFDGRTAAQYWNYMLFRELPAPLGSTDFVLVIRPELADEMGLGTGESP